MSNSLQDQQRLFGKSASPHLGRSARGQRLESDLSPIIRGVPEVAAAVLTVDAYAGCQCGCVHCATCGEGESGAGLAFLDESTLEASLDGLARGESGRVLIGAKAEPYPQSETAHGATRALLRRLARRNGLSVSLYTRSPLSQRDAPLFRELAARHSFQLHICLPSLRESLLGTLEPGAPAAPARLAAIGRLAALRIPAGLRIAPVAPGLNDSLSSLESLVLQASEHDARFVSWDVLSLTESSRERFFAYLAERRPRLVERHRRIYLQRPKPSIEYQRMVATRLNALKRKYGFEADGRVVSGEHGLGPVQLAMPMAS